MINKKSTLSQCYLCGKVDKKLTIEHVPPKFLSPKSPDSKFGKISACKDCNNKYSHEESKFRDFMAVASAYKGNKSADDAYSAARRNFRRNPIGQLVLGPNKDLKRVVSNLEKRDFYTKGGIYLGTSRVISPSNDIKWDEVLIKIAKGLHFLYSGEVVPQDYKVGAKFIKEIELPDLYKKCLIKGHSGDFFHYSGGWAKEEPKTGLWYMVFYKQVGAMVWFLNPEEND